MKPQLQVIKMEPPSSTEKAMYAPIKDIIIGGKIVGINKLVTNQPLLIYINIEFCIFASS